MQEQTERSAITFVNIHLGPLPPWFFLHLLTCRSNPDIKFVYVLDNPAPDNAPSNVQFITMSVEELQLLATEKLGSTVQVDIPYKLCDLKPALGLILSEYLTDADFWVSADLDVFYGNIRKFLSEELLAEADVFHSLTYACGHFTMFRNNEYCNSLFMKTDAWKQIFADGKQHYRFDEVELERCIQLAEDSDGFQREALQIHASPVTAKQHEAWLSSFKEKYAIEPRKTLPPHLSGMCCWKNGTLFHGKSGKEVMYYHHDYKGRLWRFLLGLHQFRFKEPVSSFILDERQVAVYRSEPFLAALAYKILVGASAVFVLLSGCVMDLFRRVTPQDDHDPRTSLDDR